MAIALALAIDDEQPPSRLPSTSHALVVDDAEQQARQTVDDEVHEQRLRRRAGGRAVQRGRRPLALASDARADVGVSRTGGAVEQHAEEYGVIRADRRCVEPE